MIFCTYDPATGIIRQRFDVHESQAALQVHPGDGVYYGDADPVRQRIIGGHPCHRTLVETPPTPTSVWHEENGEWVDSRASDVRAAQAELIRLDQRAQRAILDLAINPNDEAARDRLRGIEQEKEVQRSIVRGAQPIG
jgi:hypothetical protein